MKNKDIVSKLKGFVKKNFPDCGFLIHESGLSTISFDLIFIVLDSGPFEAVKRPGVTVHPLSSITHGHSFSHSEISWDDFNRYKNLTRDAEIIFKKIINYILLNFGDNNTVNYEFIIPEDYLKTTSINPGGIAKPTKIEHKTFKGRKRRGVVESIIDSYGRYN